MTLEEHAFDEWRQGQLWPAASLACQARESGAALARPLELQRLAARAQLATRCPDLALQLLEPVIDDEAARLAVAARLMNDQWVEASAIVATRPTAFEPDYADFVTRVASTAAEGGFWQASGPPCVAVAIDTASPAPVVIVRANGIERRALVATAQAHTSVSPLVAQEHGVLDSLDIGELHIARVPYRAEDLERWETRLGVQVDMVLGADLLLRWGMRLDQSLWLGVDAPWRHSMDTGTPLFWLDGVLPSVQASRHTRLASAPSTYSFANESVGVFVIDTAGPAVTLTTLGRDRLSLTRPVPDGAIEETQLAIDEEQLPLRDVLSRASIDVLDAFGGEYPDTPILGRVGWSAMWLDSRRVSTPAIDTSLFQSPTEPACHGARADWPAPPAAVCPAGPLHPGNCGL